MKPSTATFSLHFMCVVPVGGFRRGAWEIQGRSAWRRVYTKSRRGGILKLRVLYGLKSKKQRNRSRYKVRAGVQIYLTTLESVKTYSMGTTSQVTGSEAGAAAAANFVAGGTASLVTQSVIVPVDVVSQRLMVAGMGEHAATQGLLYSAHLDPWALASQPWSLGQDCSCPQGGCGACTTLHGARRSLASVVNQVLHECQDPDLLIFLCMHRLCAGRLVPDSDDHPPQRLLP